MSKSRIIAERALDKWAPGWRERDDEQDRFVRDFVFEVADEAFKAGAREEATAFKGTVDEKVALQIAEAQAAAQLQQTAAVTAERAGILNLVTGIGNDLQNEKGPLSDAHLIIRLVELAILRRARPA